MQVQVDHHHRDQIEGDIFDDDDEVKLSGMITCVYRAKAQNTQARQARLVVCSGNNLLHVSIRHIYKNRKPTPPFIAHRAPPVLKDGHHCERRWEHTSTVTIYTSNSEWHCLYSRCPVRIIDTHINKKRTTVMELTKVNSRAEFQTETRKAAGRHNPADRAWGYFTGWQATTNGGGQVGLPWLPGSWQLSVSPIQTLNYKYCIGFIAHTATGADMIIQYITDYVRLVILHDGQWDCSRCILPRRDEITGFLFVKGCWDVDSACGGEGVEPTALSTKLFFGAELSAAGSVASSVTDGRACVSDSVD